METVHTVINAVVVALVGLAVTLAGKGRFDRLEQRIDRLEERLDGSVNALRADLTQVALAVGARPRTRNA